MKSKLQFKLGQVNSHDNTFALILYQGSDYDLMQCHSTLLSQ